MRDPQGGRSGVCLAFWPLRPELRLITLTMELAGMKGKRTDERFLLSFFLPISFQTEALAWYYLGKHTLGECAPSQSNTAKDLATVI